MSKLAALDDYQAITNFLNGDQDKLNTQQLQLYARIDFADGMVRKYGGGRTTAKRMAAHYALKKIKYSLRQAYLDMNAAIELNNASNRTAKEANKLFVIELLKKEIHNVRLRETDAYKRATAIAKLSDQLNKIERYDAQDLDLPDFSEIGANEFIITNVPEEVGIVRVEVTEEIKRKYAEPKSAHSSVEDVPFTEVDPNE
jgi:hypothetical protein